MREGDEMERKKHIGKRNRKERSLNIRRLNKTENEGG